MTDSKEGSEGDRYERVRVNHLEYNTFGSLDCTPLSSHTQKCSSYIFVDLLCAPSLPDS